MVEARLPVPAHNYILKSSHAFNVLDARGAISTTERAKAFATMRRLMRDTATCDRPPQGTRLPAAA